MPHSSLLHGPPAAPRASQGAVRNWNPGGQREDTQRGVMGCDLFFQRFEYML